MLEQPTLPLTLSGLEVVFLCDAILNDDVAKGLPDRDSYYPLARSALLLLGSAYVELVDETGIAPGPVTLQVTEEAAWLLRSKVRTGDLAIDGKTNIGVSLLLKLYGILLQFNADVAGLPVVGGVDDEMTDHKRWVLKIGKESDDA